MIKKMLKNKESQQHPHLALFCLKSTPVDHKLDDPHVLFGNRQYISNMPSYLNDFNESQGEYLSYRRDGMKIIMMWDTLETNHGSSKSR